MPATHRKSIVAPVFFATLGIVVLVGLGAVMLRSVAQWAGTDIARSVKQVPDNR